MEKRNGQKKEIESLYVNGKTIKDDEKVLQEIHKYFKKVYVKECTNVHVDNYFKDLIISTLTDEEASKCEGLLFKVKRNVKTHCNVWGITKPLEVMVLVLSSTRFFG